MPGRRERRVVQRIHTRAAIDRANRAAGGELEHVDRRTPAQVGNVGESRDAIDGREGHGTGPCDRPGRTRIRADHRRRGPVADEALDLRKPRVAQEDLHRPGRGGVVDRVGTSRRIVAARNRPGRERGIGEVEGVAAAARVEGGGDERVVREVEHVVAATTADRAGDVDAVDVVGLHQTLCGPFDRDDQVGGDGLRADRGGVGKRVDERAAHRQIRDLRLADLHPVAVGTVGTQ